MLTVSGDAYTDVAARPSWLMVMYVLFPCRGRLEEGEGEQESLSGMCEEELGRVLRRYRSKTQVYSRK